MYYIIIKNNKDIVIFKNCRSVETYINSLDYKENISHTSVSRRLRNENVINFKDVQIYSSDNSFKVQKSCNCSKLKSNRSCLNIPITFLYMDIS